MLWRAGCCRAQSQPPLSICHAPQHRRPYLRLGLPDGIICMCNYSYQYEDSDFVVGDTVIVLAQRFEESKRQMYGKIMSKW